jgi:hypothetical protein
MVTAILTLAKFLMTWALDLLAYLRTNEIAQEERAAQCHPMPSDA